MKNEVNLQDAKSAVAPSPGLWTIRWSARWIAGGTIVFWGLLGLMGGFEMKAPRIEGFEQHVVYWYLLLPSMPIELAREWLAGPDTRELGLNWNWFTVAEGAFWGLQVLALVRRMKWLAVTLTVYTVISIWVLLVLAVMASNR
jgi:hypothetical protein